MTNFGAQMEQKIQQLNKVFLEGSRDDNSLLELVKSSNFEISDFEINLSGDMANYEKQIVQMEPIEVVIIGWQKGVFSAIHEHSGFFGHVVVLDGEIENTTYEFTGTELKVVSTENMRSGDIISTPDGTIHKMGNADLDIVITLHIYYPPQPTLEGTRIFDESGKLGVLNTEAKVASFDQDNENFSELKENSFSFIH